MTMDGFNIVSGHLKNTGMSIDEEREYYFTVLDKVIANPRFYLDNLEALHVFRCSFINYNKR